MVTKSTQNNGSVIRLFSWKFFDRTSTQVIQFVVQIILARILDPDLYGIVIIINGFLLFSNLLVDSGLSTALIQKYDIDSVDINSVFLFTFINSLIIYIVVYAFSPFFAYFLNNDLIIMPLKILGLTLLVNSWNSISYALARRKLQFKAIFISGFIATILSSTVGIYLAIRYKNIWSLIIQQILYRIINSIILGKTSKWKFRFEFSMARILLLYKFGLGIFFSSFLDVLYRNFRTFSIGKVYSAEQLSYYYRGEQFPQTIISNVSGTLQSVMFPIMSSKQTDINKVRNLQRKTIVSISFIVFPMMCMLAISSYEIVLILLTDKWILAHNYLRIFCLSWSLYPITITNIQALNALGRSDVNVKLQSVHKIISILIVLLTVRISVEAIAIGQLLADVLLLCIYFIPNIRILKYTFKDQITDISVSLLISLGIFMLQNFWTLQIGNLYIRVLINSILIFVAYILLSVIFRSSGLNLILKKIRTYIHR